MREALAASVPDAVRVTVGCVVVALTVNAWIHPEPIPLIAEREYDILVPCPEPGGEVAAMTCDDPLLHAVSTFLVDARHRPEYAQWHFRDAVNVPYRYLDPTPRDTLEALAAAIARSRARRVAVYGDGDNPDTGMLLGREISGHGIRHVFYVRGGARALRRAQEPNEGRHTESRRAP